MAHRHNLHRLAPEVFVLSESRLSHSKAYHIMDRTVTITVVSCDGVVAKRNESKTKKKLKNRQVTKSSTSLVASFIQNVGDNSFLTHVPSTPMEQLDTLYMKPGRANAIPQPHVRWHGNGMDAEKGGDATVGKELSTLRFTRRFLHYTGRLLPETFPLNLSLSSGGKLIPMGKAEIIITGNEKGDSYIDVPISSTIKKAGVSNPMKKSSKNHIPMVRVKGDDLQFGLKGDSILRVIVSVTDAQEQDVINHVQEDAYVHQDTEEVTTDDTTFDEPDDNYGSFLEFLSEESDAHAYASDLSYESDRLVNADDVNKVEDPHPTGELPTLQLIDEGEVSEDEEKANEADVCCLWERFVSTLVSKPAALVVTASVEREESHGNVRP